MVWPLLPRRNISAFGGSKSPQWVQSRVHLPDHRPSWVIEGKSPRYRCINCRRRDHNHKRIAHRLARPRKGLQVNHSKGLQGARTHFLSRGFRSLLEVICRYKVDERHNTSISRAKRAFESGPSVIANSTAEIQKASIDRIVGTGDKCRLVGA